jgi:hypothetical protein
MCKIEQICGVVFSQSDFVKKEELTRRQISYVPCPTCGVAVGKPCIVYSGGLRFEAHVARKLSAIEALERK